MKRALFVGKTAEELKPRPSACRHYDFIAVDIFLKKRMDMSRQHVLDSIFVRIHDRLKLMPFFRFHAVGSEAIRRRDMEQYQHILAPILFQGALQKVESFGLKYPL